MELKKSKNGWNVAFFKKNFEKNFFFREDINILFFWQRAENGVKIEKKGFRFPRGVCIFWKISDLHLGIMTWILAGNLPGIAGSLPDIFKQTFFERLNT